MNYKKLVRVVDNDHRFDKSIQHSVDVLRRLYEYWKDAKYFPDGWDDGIIEKLLDLKNDFSMLLGDDTGYVSDSVSYKPIEYDDDIVVVKNPQGKIIYEGWEDYDPNKDEDWVLDRKTMIYSVETPSGVYTKYCTKR